MATNKTNTTPTNADSTQLELTPNSYVTVKSGFHGKLIYKSRKTGEIFIWDELGAEQEMELAELRAAKNSYKDYFINNWFLFDDPEVIKYLGVGSYYKHSLNPASFDDLFKKKPSEIKKIVSALPKAQQKSLIYKTKELIKNKEIDSLRVIGALEESLNTTLIER